MNIDGRKLGWIAIALGVLALVFTFGRHSATWEMAYGPQGYGARQDYVVTQGVPQAAPQVQALPQQTAPQVQAAPQFIPVHGGWHHGPHHGFPLVPLLLVGLVAFLFFRRREPRAEDYREPPTSEV